MKNVWIVNHNATPPSMGGLVRHYYFSKFLPKDSYNIRIITASTIHNANVNMITGKEKLLEKEVDGIPYTFLRCGDYKGNGLLRIKNMLEFPLRLWQTYKSFETPDVIYTSSPDLLAAAAAILLAKQMKKPCILEVRDHWPEAIVCYKKMSRKNPIIICLYMLEKWMYKQADRIVFTAEGGGDYIVEHGWDNNHGGPVDMSKVYNINNGVDLEEFDYNKEHCKLQDADLNAPDTFKIVYTGSIRLVNKLKLLVDAAELLRDEKQIKFIVYGDGPERKFLEQYCKENNIDNVLFKGKVEKKYIPYIVSQASSNFMNGEQTPIVRFGLSPNKLFDYLASGRPVLSNLKPAHCLVTRHNCGVVTENQTAEAIKDGVMYLYTLNKTEFEKMGENARRTALNYDYRVLTQSFEKVIDFENAKEL